MKKRRIWGRIGGGLFGGFYGIVYIKKVNLFNASTQSIKDSVTYDVRLYLADCPAFECDCYYIVDAPKYGALIDIQYTLSDNPNVISCDGVVVINDSNALNGFIYLPSNTYVLLLEKDGDLVMYRYVDDVAERVYVVY